METIVNMITRFYAGMYERYENEDEGATVVEYALIVSLISIAAVATFILLGPAINTAFDTALKAFG